MDDLSRRSVCLLTSLCLVSDYWFSEDLITSIFRWWDASQSLRNVVNYFQGNTTLRSKRPQYTDKYITWNFTHSFKNNKPNASNSTQSVYHKTQLKIHQPMKHAEIISMYFLLYFVRFFTRSKYNRLLMWKLHVFLVIKSSERI